MFSRYIKMRCQNRNFVRLVIAAIVILTLSVWYFKSSSTKLVIQENTRKKLVYDLQQVLTYLQSPKVHTSVKENHQLQHNVFRIIRLFDPTYYRNWKNHSQPSPTTKTSASLVCPEYFTNYSAGWVKTEHCANLPTFAKELSLTFFFEDDKSCSYRLYSLLESFKQLKSENPIHIGLRKNSKCLQRLNGMDNRVTVHRFSTKTTPGKIWNELVSKVKTQFVLIGRNSYEINQFSGFERQISVFDVDPRIRIVGGSVRNETGHWQVGCYQTRLINYILEYKDGYQYSKNECMICDHILSPFIAKTDFLQQKKFDTSLSESILFEEFFLRILDLSIYVFNCPDAMYMAQDPGEVSRVSDKATWLPVIRKFALNRVVLPDRIIHKFSCKESNMNCVDLYKRSNSLMMPLCCMDALANGLKQFHTFCTKNDIIYQVEGGTLLGAVKLRDIIPWDFNGEGRYYENYKNHFSNVLNLSNRDGEVFIDHQNEKADGFFKVSVPDAYIEFFADSDLTADHSEMTEIFQDTPTLVRIRGHWVYGPPSPGLFARNMYGNEYLRHVNNWWSLGKEQFDPYEEAKAFLPCHDPHHHACIDQFETDGNTQFDLP